MGNKDTLKIFHPKYAGDLKRLGNDYDGGYIVHYPSLKDAEYLINYGVGYNVNFEKDFFKASGVPTLAFDPTLKNVRPILKKLGKGEIVPFLRHLKNYMVWIYRERTLKNYKINFIEEGIAFKDSGAFKSLAYHFNKYQLYGKKIIFKLDVEGSEYEVLNDPSIYELLCNSVQIIIEFHEISKNMDNLITIMQNILKTHSLIHIHSNNHEGTFEYNGKNVPELIEVTFLLNEYLPEDKFTTTNYPVKGLDQPCNRLKEDIVLDFFY